MTIGDLVADVLGTDLPVAIQGYDGSRVGPVDAPARIVIRSPDALGRIVRAPGELGFGRAYVAGELDVEGDIFAVLALRDHLPEIRLSRQQWADARAASRGRTR